MDDVLGYSGKKVVVGGAASGMGQATAAALVDMGAHVVSLDIKEPTVEVKEHVQVDLRDKASVDSAVATLGDGIDAVFACAGLPGAPFSDRDVMLVNFVGTRHFLESVLPSVNKGGAIAWVSSNAGLGWQMNMETLGKLLEAEGFEAGCAWLDANPDTYANGASYPLSKQLSNAYIASRALRFWESGEVRLNCTNPGPTATPMMDAFETNNGEKMVKAALGPIERYSTAEEQAWPLLYLNSPRSSYVTGEAFMVDGGFFGAMQSGQIDLVARFSQ